MGLLPSKTTGAEQAARSVAYVASHQRFGAGWFVGPASLVCAGNNTWHDQHACDAVRVSQSSRVALRICIWMGKHMIQKSMVRTSFCNPGQSQHLMESVMSQDPESKGEWLHPVWTCCSATHQVQSNQHGVWFMHLRQQPWCLSVPMAVLADQGASSSAATQWQHTALHGRGSCFGHSMRLHCWSPLAGSEALRQCTATCSIRPSLHSLLPSVPG